MIFKSEDFLLAWASGLFEGEGTISIAKNGVRAVVEMTDLDVIETLYKNFGGKIYEFEPRQTNWKKSWKWTLTSSKETIIFLKKILPFLHSRRSLRVEEAICDYENRLKNKEDRKAKVLKLRNDIKEKYHSDTSISHKELANLFKVDRTYVTHIINDTYKK